MTSFVATMTYELSAATDAEARKLLRAELVGRRWLDRFEDGRMPANAVWAKRNAPEEHTTDDVLEACCKDLYAAVMAVAKTGRTIALVRAWVQVSGAGSWGLVKPPQETQ